MGLWVSFQKGRVSARTQNFPEVKAGGESPGDAPTPRVSRAIEEALRPPRPAPEASMWAVGFSFLKRDPQAHPSGIFLPFGVRNLSNHLMAKALKLDPNFKAADDARQPLNR